MYVLACENGTFGEDCSEKCGHCAPIGHCHHINGTCYGGCTSGYKGLACIERM